MAAVSAQEAVRQHTLALDDTFTVIDVVCKDGVAACCFGGFVADRIEMLVSCMRTNPELAATILMADAKFREEFNHWDDVNDVDMKIDAYKAKRRYLKDFTTNIKIGDLAILVNDGEAPIVGTVEAISDGYVCNGKHYQYAQHYLNRDQFVSVSMMFEEFKAKLQEAPLASMI